MKRYPTLLLLYLCACTGEQSDDALDTDTDTDTDATVDTRWEGLDDEITPLMTEGRIPGLAVAITQPGEVLWTGAYGLADVTSGRAVTPDTPFMLASVSKTVTAAAVMKAQENGDLTLDDGLHALLPFAVDNPKVDDETIQLRHLVSHTSGIRDNWGNMPYADGDSPYALGTYLEGYLVPDGEWYDADQNFYAYAPGTDTNYGNIATALAGYVVEVQTQTPFDDYCDANLFDGLGMQHTGWHLADFDPSTVAMPHQRNGENYTATGHYGYPDYPDGQLRSSIADMARFLAAMTHEGTIDDARVLSSETVAEMFRAPVPDVNPGQFVFWYEFTIGGRAVIGHNGGDIGVATQMSFSPETGIGVIILMNIGWTDSVTPAAEAIQGLLYERAEAME